VTVNHRHIMKDDMVFHAPTMEAEGEATVMYVKGFSLDRSNTALCVTYDGVDEETGQTNMEQIVDWFPVIELRLAHHP